MAFRPLRQVKIAEGFSPGAFSRHSAGMETSAAHAKGPGLKPCRSKHIFSGLKATAPSIKTNNGEYQASIYRSSVAAHGLGSQVEPVRQLEDQRGSRLQRSLRMAH